MKLIDIHGHGETSDSLNFIRSQIGGNWISLEYNSSNGFTRNIGTMIDLIEGDDDVFFVVHSLGGLYALHLANILRERCVGAVTMATPYGGCDSALTLSFALAMSLKPPEQLYRDIHPHSNPVTQGRDIILHRACKWTAIVTTRGHSNLIGAANDGVVTRGSMHSRFGAKFAYVDSTHHGVLQSHHTVDIIKAALQEVEELELTA